MREKAYSEIKLVSSLIRDFLVVSGILFWVLVIAIKIYS